MEFPENLKYTEKHEWIKLDGDIATVGITAFAQSELGDIVFIDIDTEGETLDADEIFGTVEAVKTVSDLFIPMSGEVIEINPLLDDQPELINNDPFGDGWIIKVKVSDLAEYNNLLDAEAYKSFVGH